MFDENPIKLSRDLERIAERVEAFEQRLRRRVVDDDPFGGRDFPGKTLRGELLDLPEADPLRSFLLAWTDHLIERRLDRLALLGESVRVHEVRSRGPAPFTEPLSLAEIRHLLLLRFSESRTKRGEGAASAAAEARILTTWLLDAGRPLSMHRRELLERRREIDERIGAPALFRGLEVTPRPRADSAFGAPSPAPNDSGVDPVEALARDLLDRTADAILETGAQEPFDHLGLLLGLGAEEGWPARIAEDTLTGLLGPGRWLTGVRLAPFPLPERLNPASFFRAVRRVFLALGRAHERQDLPFVRRREPTDTRSRALGEAFLLFMSRSVFLGRRLGIGRDFRAAPARALSRMVTSTARLLAMRVLVEGAVRRGLGAVDSELDERSRQLGAPDAAFLLVPAGTASARAAFMAAVLGAALEERLINGYDEDWPESPRAVAECRESLTIPPTLSVAEAELDLGVAALVRRANEAL